MNFWEGIEKADRVNWALAVIAEITVFTASYAAEDNFEDAERVYKRLREPLKDIRDNLGTSRDKESLKSLLKKEDRKADHRIEKLTANSCELREALNGIWENREQYPSLGDLPFIIDELYRFPSRLGKVIRGASRRSDYEEIGENVEGKLIEVIEEGYRALEEFDKRGDKERVKSFYDEYGGIPFIMRYP